MYNTKPNRVPTTIEYIMNTVRSDARSCAVGGVLVRVRLALLRLRGVHTDTDTLCSFDVDFFRSNDLPHTACCTPFRDIKRTHAYCDLYTPTPRAVHHVAKLSTDAF